MHQRRRVTAQTQILLCLTAISLVGLCSGAAATAHGQVPARRLYLPPQPYNYARAILPAYARAVTAECDNTPDDNPITNAGATLGRVLFYDPTLSANASTSCASCHQQSAAFTDPRPLSIGFAGERVPRNSMSLVNLRYYRRGAMFWDERAATLETQVLMPIENPVEMGHNLKQLIPQLQRDPIYPPLFQRAFGDPQVTPERVSRALAQFVRALVSFQSPYDVGRAQVEKVTDPFPNFTEQENYGKQQFFGRARCAECHLPDRFTAIDAPAPPATTPTPEYLETYPYDEPAARPHSAQSALFFLERPVVNGIDSGEPPDDAGVGKVTGKAADVGKFKVPSLRNVQVTGPYMHDGRFITLDQVLEHYNWSVRPHANLDRRLADFAANGLALPEVEKVALARFLDTLTDKAFLADPRFADPFAARESDGGPGAGSD